jgi:hypothetical protein
MEPELWLSPVQLLHLASYSFLERQAVTAGHKVDAAHHILIRYRSAMQRLIRRLAEDGEPALDGDPGSPQRRAAAQAWLDEHFGTGPDGHQPRVHLGELPRVLTRALVQADHRPPDDAAIAERIDHLVHDSEARIRRLDATLVAYARRGKDGFRPVKAGPVAVFLTEDLLRFQPVDETKLDAGGGKLTSQQYQILEAALAYYAIHLDEPPRIADLLRNAGLLGGERAHPFLHRLNLEGAEPYTSIMGFYRPISAPASPGCAIASRQIAAGPTVARSAGCACANAPRWSPG